MFQRLFVLTLCCSFALLLTRSFWDSERACLETVRARRHVEVLAGVAETPYQQNMYWNALVVERLAGQFHLRRTQAMLAMRLVGHVLLFMSVAYFLARLGAPVAGQLTGLAALAAYGCFLMPCSGEHPADPWGTSLFTFALAFAHDRRSGALLAISLVAGFVWLKHVMILPALLVLAALRGSREDARFAWVVGLASAIGPLCSVGAFGLPPDTGVQTTARMLASLPEALCYQAGMSLAPILSALYFRRRLPAVLWAGLAVYPVMLICYAAAHFYLEELRSFWLDVPVFVALLVQWVSAPETADEAASAREVARTAAAASTPDAETSQASEPLV